MLPPRPSLENNRVTRHDCGENGDGYNPYGVETDIACDAATPCDRENGLMCGIDLLRAGVLGARVTIPVAAMHFR